MRTLKLGLTPEQVARRVHSIGGSDSNIIASGDAPRIYDLWLEKTGQKAPDDLSAVLPVMLGSWTEEFNRYWYERTTGRDVTAEGLERKHPVHGWMTSTLDGRTTTEAGELAIFEAKHVNAFSKLDEVVQRYAPQLTHNMLVDGMDWAVLSIFIGTQSYEIFEMALDGEFAAELIRRETDFWRAVESRTPPVDMPALAAPVPQSEWRDVDLTGNNAFANLAADWLEHRGASKKFRAADEGIKKLVEPDVGKATGHGICVSRAKNRALTVREASA